MRRTRTRLIAAAACLPFLGAANLAMAADIGEGGYKDDPAATGDYSVASVKVGGYLVIKPSYEGSDEYELTGFPYILPQFAGGSEDGIFSRIDARGLDDVRLELVRTYGFIAGPLVGYNFGREEDDGDLLDGLGDIDGGVVAGGFIGYRWNWVQFDVSYHHFFDDSEGYQLRFGAEIERPISERVTLTTRVGATYADENYTQTYFGISTAQALNSGAGLGAFDADAGFKDVNVTVGLKADLTDQWAASASLRYSRLIGDAADSPVVEDENQFTGMLGLSYKFYTPGW